MNALSPKQSAIIREFNDKDEFSLADAVKLVGGNIYHNRTKYVGEILARMIKRGLVVRVRKGFYKLKQKWNTPNVSDPDCKWCEGSGCLCCEQKKTKNNERKS